MNLYNLSFRMVFIIHMYQIAHVPLYWEYKKLYPGGLIKLLPPPPHLLHQWLFYLYRTRIGYIWIKKHVPSVPGDKGAIKFFWLVIIFAVFFIRIRTTPVSADIAKYIVGYFNYLSHHHALSYLPSQWSCGWSSLPKISQKILFGWIFSQLL